MLIETDVLIALNVPVEKRHSEVIEIARSIKQLAVSPYALIELDLLLQSISLEDRS